MKDISSMSHTEKIEVISARIIEAQKERSEAEKEANAHEEEARKCRRTMTELKQEIAQLTTVLNHTQVVKSVTDNEAKAKRVLAEAEESRARALTVEKELNELVAKAKSEQLLTPE